MPRAGRLAVILVLQLLMLDVLVVSGLALHVDVVAKLVRVVDGDTVRIVVVEVCSPRFSWLAGFRGRLRLADINAPELSTEAGVEAKLALEKLLSGRRLLYIDVDDLRVFDRYGRIVGVLLVDWNETHLLNVNEWLVLHGYARPVDYPNEFHPRWSLYVPRSVARCGGYGGGVPVWVAAVLLLLVLLLLVRRFTS